MTCRTPAYRTANHSTAGFTLAELLVVVAIVAVLVAIAVPVFTGALGSSEEATCEANRRSLKSMYTTAWLLDQTPGNQKTLYQACVDQLEEQNKGVLCPNDGVYRETFNKKTGAVSIVCLIHGASYEDKAYAWINDNTWTGGDDSTHRGKYAAANNLDEWPEITGINNEAVYLSFKTYGNSSDTAYLYAGKAQSVSDKNPWRANYLCDTTGEIFGTPGQWYQLTSEINLGTKPDGTGEALKSKLRDTFGEDYASTLGKVNLVNGKFVAV